MPDSWRTNPGMAIVSLIPNEPWVGRLCPNCHRPFKPHEKVFESVDQAVAIHVPCVVSLALLASVHEHNSDAREVQSEYRRHRDALLNEMEGNDVA